MARQCLLDVRFAWEQYIRFLSPCQQLICVPYQFELALAFHSEQLDFAECSQPCCFNIVAAWEVVLLASGPRTAYCVIAILVNWDPMQGEWCAQQFVWVCTVRGSKSAHPFSFRHASLVWWKLHEDSSSVEDIVLEGWGSRAQGAVLC